MSYNLDGLKALLPEVRKLKELILDSEFGNPEDSLAHQKLLFIGQKQLARDGIDHIIFVLKDIDAVPAAMITTEAHNLLRKASGIAERDMLSREITMKAAELASNLMLECKRLRAREEVKKTTFHGQMAKDYLIPRIGKPWEGEGNFKQWRHADYDCVILRNRNFGHLCGYVGVPKGHPFHDLNYNRIQEQYPEFYDIHGNLTYSGPNADNVLMHGGDDLWWIGFDCNHSFDYGPKSPTGGSPSDYKTMDYVMKETEKLAEMLTQVKEKAEN